MSRSRSSSMPRIVFRNDPLDLVGDVFGDGRAVREQPQAKPTVARVGGDLVPIFAKKHLAARQREKNRPHLRELVEERAHALRRD